MSTKDRRTASSSPPRSDPPVTDPFADLDDDDEEEDDEEGCSRPSKHCSCGADDEEEEGQDGLSILGLADGLLSTLHTLGQYRAVTHSLEAVAVLDRLEQSLVARLSEVTVMVEKLKFSAEEDPDATATVPTNRVLS